MCSQKYFLRISCKHASSREYHNKWETSKSFTMLRTARYTKIWIACKSISDSFAEECQKFTFQLPDILFAYLDSRTYQNCLKVNQKPWAVKDSKGLISCHDIDRDPRERGIYETYRTLFTSNFKQAQVFVIQNEIFVFFFPLSLKYLLVKWCFRISWLRSHCNSADFWNIDTFEVTENPDKWRQLNETCH